MQRLINKFSIKEEPVAILLFLTIGSAAAIIYLLIFAALYQWAHFDYRIAVSIGYILAVTFHFISNRRLTFKAHSQNARTQLFKYVFYLLFNYVATLVIMHLTITILKHSPYLGLFLAIGFTTIFNYLLLKNWIFSK